MKNKVQKTMNPKWKVITPIMLIIISICTGFTALFILESERALKHNIELHIKSVRRIATVIVNQNTSKYQKRIKSFLKYDNSPNKSELIQAFAKRDQETTLKLSEPYLQLFKNEDPYFSTFTWVLDNNISFLHVHNSGKKAVDVSTWRPDVVQVNREYGQFIGFAVSPVGLQHRIVNSVSYDGKHIGVLHFGMQDNQLLDAIHKELQIPVGQVLPKEKYQFIKKSTIPTLVGKEYSLQSYQLDVFGELFARIDWSLETQQLAFENKDYVIAKVVSLNNYIDEPQGYIFVALDISEWTATVNNNIQMILIASFLAIMLSFLIMYFGYALLAPKLIDIQVVENVNRELKNKVAERTRELLKNDRYLKAIFDAPSDAIFVHDTKTGAILDVNQAMLNIFGLTHEEALGATFNELSLGQYPYNAEEVIKKMQLAVTDGPQMFEWMARKKTGEVFWVEIGLKVTEIEEKSYIIAILREIDSRKKLEEQLRLFKTFVETSNQGMWWSNTDGSIVYANPALNRLFGKKNTEAVIGKNVATSYYAEKEQKKIAQEVFPTVEKKGSWAGDLMLQQTGGKQIPTYNSLFIVRDNNGKALFFANIVTDITERKQIIDTMKKMHQELEEKVQERTVEYKQAKEEAEFANQSKSEFLANMSHELRTPMHGILSYADFGINRSQKVSRDKLLEYFYEIGDSGKRLMLLLNDLLDLAKLESGKMPYNITCQDLTLSVQQVVHEFMAMATSKGVKLTFTPSDEALLACYDYDRIGQVLRNLLSNSIKFSKAGTRVSIVTGNETIEWNGKNEEAIKISVIDQGIGVPKGELKRIFNKFIQSSSTKTGAGGTGLGLSICRQIVEDHEGAQLFAKRGVEGGMIFNLVLLKNMTKNG